MAKEESAMKNSLLKFSLTKRHLGESMKPSSISSFRKVPILPERTVVKNFDSEFWSLLTESAISSPFRLLRRTRVHERQSQRRRQVKHDHDQRPCRLHPINKLIS